MNRMVEALKNYNWPINYSYHNDNSKWSPYIYPRFKTYEDLKEINEYQALNAARYHHNWQLGRNVDIWV